MDADFVDAVKRIIYICLFVYFVVAYIGGGSFLAVCGMSMFAFLLGRELAKSKPRG